MLVYFLPLVNFKNPIFDTDPLAILNCYKYNYESAKDNNVDVLINIGCLTTSILVYGENQEFFTREISIGGHHINLEIMNLNHTNYSDALDLQVEKGMQAFDLDEITFATSRTFLFSLDFG